MTQEAVFSKDGIKGWILAVLQESAPFCVRLAAHVSNRCKSGIRPVVGRI